MGIPPRIIGQGHRIYGYKFILDERGKRVGVELNLDVIHVEPDGTEWTEPKVIRYIFESAANGVPIRQIAQELNKKGIPSTYATMGIKTKRMKQAPVWQPSAVGQKLKQSDYWGEHKEFQKRSIGRMPGKTHYKRLKNPLTEQVIIPVPAIVTKELAEEPVVNLAMFRTAPVRSPGGSRRAGSSTRGMVSSLFPVSKKVPASVRVARRGAATSSA